jgi:hypothetical protein
MVILTPTQDFVDSLITIAQDFPEEIAKFSWATSNVLFIEESSHAITHS